MNRSETTSSQDIIGEVKQIEFDLAVNIAEYREAEAKGDDLAALVLQKQAMFLLSRMPELDPQNPVLKKLGLDTFLKDLSIELTKKLNSKESN